jgi:hypothetical protein
MSTMELTEFSERLKKIARLERESGRQEMRLATMRWLIARGQDVTAAELATMPVDVWLKAGQR